VSGISRRASLILKIWIQDRFTFLVHVGGTDEVPKMQTEKDKIAQHRSRATPQKKVGGDADLLLLLWETFRARGMEVDHLSKADLRWCSYDLADPISIPVGA
jgi:hypothetical protein